jgi:hypothetical protein
MLAAAAALGLAAPPPAASTPTWCRACPAAGSSPRAGRHDRGGRPRRPRVRVRLRRGGGRPRTSRRPRVRRPGRGAPAGSQLLFDVPGDGRLRPAREPVVLVGAGPCVRPVPSGESFRLNLGSQNLTITGTGTGPQAGSRSGTVRGSGSIHRHLNAFLNGATGTTGRRRRRAGGRHLRVPDAAGQQRPSILASDPIYMVFNNGLTRTPTTRRSRTSRRRWCRSRRRPGWPASPRSPGCSPAAAAAGRPLNRTRPTTLYRPPPPALRRVTGGRPPRGLAPGAENSGGPSSCKDLGPPGPT